MQKSNSDWRTLRLADFPDLLNITEDRQKATFGIYAGHVTVPAGLLTVTLQGLCDTSPHPQQSPNTPSPPPLFQYHSFIALLTQRVIWDELYWGERNTIAGWPAKQGLLFPLAHDSLSYRSSGGRNSDPGCQKGQVTRHQPKLQQRSTTVSQRYENPIRYPSKLQ